jgi:restriction endonuclease S subunit
MLKDNGICGIVLPDGNELTSNGYYNIRKYLINNCKIIKVINVSGGTFGSTGVKTKVIIFKKQKGIDNDKNIDFLEINKNCDELKLIATTNLDKKYSFKLKVNQDFILKDDYVIKSLGEICEIIKGPKKRSKDANEKGLYPLYYCSIIGNLYLDTYDYTDEGIIINKTNGSGKTMIYYGTKNYNVGETTIHFKSKLLNIKTKYIYYYLLYNKQILEQNYYGLNQQSITDEDLFKIEIPIPSIEIQNKKVDEIDKLEVSIETIKLRIEQIKHEQNYILNSILSTDIDNIQYKMLGEIASINIGGTPKRDNLEYYNNGNNLWVSIRELNNNIIYDTKEKITDLGVKNSNVKLLPINTILFAFKLSIGKIGITGVPLYTNEAIAGINTNDDTIIINKYLYYYLYNTDFKDLASGMLGNVGSLNKKILEDLKIQIPSIEKQKDIIDILDGINNRINEDIKYIEVLRKLISKSI